MRGRLHPAFPGQRLGIVQFPQCVAPCWEPFLRRCGALAGFTHERTGEERFPNCLDCCHEVPLNLSQTKGSNRECIDYSHPPMIFYRTSAEAFTMARYVAFWGCFIQGRLPFIERSLRLALDALGVDHADLDGFTCCPEKSLIMNRSEDAWLLTAARNLALVEEARADVFSPCNGCVSTLKGARYRLLSDQRLLASVNERLAQIGRRFTGRSRVFHLIELLHDQIGTDVIARRVSRPLDGMRVAVHAGCHQMRPAAETKVDDPMNPEKFENVVRALGAEVVDYPSKLLCCGGTMNTAGLVEPAREMTRRKLLDLAELEVDCLAVTCPACFMQYDLAQLEMAREGFHYNVPVAALSELMAVAFGISPTELGLDMHRIPIQPVLQRWAEEKTPASALAELDLEAMAACVECRACSRNCAVHKLEPDFDPWEIFQRVLDNELHAAIADPRIFKCVECYECQELCFQHWGMIKGLRALKRLAIERGLAPEAVMDGVENFVKTGLLTQPSSQRRNRLGLPPAGKPGTEELEKLLRGAMPAPRLQQVAPGPRSERAARRAPRKPTPDSNS